MEGIGWMLVVMMSECLDGCDKAYGLLVGYAYLVSLMGFG